jgi:ribosomal protein L11 methyltransferase
MEKIALDGPWSMLDVGTGSGILAIYGAFLGAKKVAAIDKDREALRWAKRNMELNELTHKIELSSVPVNRLKGAFTLLTANLIYTEIIKILNHLERLTAPAGWLIVSGILIDQKTKTERALEKSGFLPANQLHVEEWICILARKEGGHR